MKPSGLRRGVFLPTHPQRGCGLSVLGLLLAGGVAVAAGAPDEPRRVLPLESFGHNPEPWSCAAPTSRTELALSLMPETSHIVAVLGNSPLEQAWAA
jgi:hypothetical protein